MKIATTSISSPTASPAYREGAAPEISYGPVKITTSQPAVRAYGALGEALEAKKDAAHA